MINAVKDHAADLDAAARADRARGIRSRQRRTTSPRWSCASMRCPEQSANEVHRQLTELPFPPQLAARMKFDGFTILRELHASSRSHVYLASDDETAAPVVIKTLSTELQGDVAHLERFLMEDWVAQRISNAHVVKAAARGRRAQLSIHGDRIHRRPDAASMAHRQSEAGGRNRARTHRADRERPARVPPPGDAAPGPAAAERDDRRHRHGEDHRLRLRRAWRASRRSIHRSHAASCWARCSTPRRSISWARAARRARICFRWASSPTRCCPAACRIGAEVPKARTRAAQRQLQYRSVLDDEREIPGLDRRGAAQGHASGSR